MKIALPASVLAFSAALVTPHSFAIELTPDLQAVVNVGALSEYNMRGVSFSQRKPVVQGSVMLMHSSGLYGGVWGSNVDIKGLEANYETDYVVGYVLPFNDQVNLDVGYIRYTYPKSSYFNVGETYGVLTAYGFKLGANYSNDSGINQDDAYLYTYVGYGNKNLLPMGLGLDVRFGVNDLKDPGIISANGNTQSRFNEWEVKLSKNIAGIDFAASYIDTNLSKSQCLSYVNDQDSCSARLLVGVTKTF